GVLAVHCVGVAPREGHEVAGARRAKWFWLVERINCEGAQTVREDNGVGHRIRVLEVHPREHGHLHAGRRGAAPSEQHQTVEAIAVPAVRWLRGALRRARKQPRRRRDCGKENCDSCESFVHLWSSFRRLIRQATFTWGWSVAIVKRPSSSSAVT